MPPSPTPNPGYPSSIGLKVIVPKFPFETGHTTSPLNSIQEKFVVSFIPNGTVLPDGFEATALPQYISGEMIGTSISFNWKYGMNSLLNHPNGVVLTTENVCSATPPQSSNEIKELVVISDGQNVSTIGSSLHIDLEELQFLSLIHI